MQKVHLKNPTINKMEASENVNLVIGKVRLSYVKLFEGDGEKTTDSKGKIKYKYGVSMLIDKKDKALIAKIQEAENTLVATYKQKFKGAKPKAMPLRDGDEDRPEDDAYVGCMFINGSAYKPEGQYPSVVKRVEKGIYENVGADVVYSGCYAYAEVSLYIYDNSFGRGIACSLNKILFAGNGERLAGSGVSVSAAFDDVEIDSLEDDDLG